MRLITRARCGTAGVLLAAVLTAGCAGGGGAGSPSPAESAGTSPAPPASAGTATPASTPASASASANPAPARPLVGVTVTGGIAGVHNTLLVQDDGTYTTSSRTGPARTGRMTPAELAALRRALEKADFAHLPREATGSPIADGFTYRLTYAGHTVTTDDTTRLPALRAVFAALPQD
ncbi:protealysin inhibitor emfourin [Streptomyces sp. NPDC005279]|uniref:protealysin inhibitor emfourin n=1 Tax=Streptomyces sp. NPDC005279 TaxID=3364712 RepID=UPI00368F8414